MQAPDVDETRSSPTPEPTLATGETDDAAPPEEGSLYPAVVAAGVTLLLFGFSAGVVFAGAGALLLALGVGGWIGEVRPPLGEGEKGSGPDA
ncbi:MAG TPA: hypothetical protein VHS99_04950 [Chloroflexota bacterium]|jgi:hypothetical protein|nr:hypothetical protein [Chloroflexota bacterium]